jgi:hypothetical protein
VRDVEWSFRGLFGEDAVDFAGTDIASLSEAERLRGG